MTLKLRNTQSVARILFFYDLQISQHMLENKYKMKDIDRKIELKGAVQMLKCNQ